MGAGPDVTPEALPIIISANTGRTSAIARLVLGCLVVLGLAAAVALPVHNRFGSTMPPRPRFDYDFAAVVGGAVALLAGFLWVVALPVTWTVDAGGITQEGPGDRRRDLRWADVRRIQPGRPGYAFHGRTGLIPIVLPWEAISKDRRAAVCAAVESALREHFDVPPPFTWKTLAPRLFVWYAVIFLPLLAYVVPLNRLVKTSPRTIVGWTWVRRLITWNVDAAPFLVTLIVFAPPFLYMILTTWLLTRKMTRDAQILPKRPGAP